MNKPHGGDGMVRIIGGKYRGRKIPVLSQEGLRPTPDRVRETLFNWLAPYLPGARCLDLFGGTGVLSFEALSRGAAFATLIEKSLATFTSITRVANTLNVGSAFQALCADSLHWLTNHTHDKETPFDIVFIDPPFHQQLVDAACKQLSASARLAPDALIYIECEHGAALHLPDNWQPHRAQSAGGVDYALYRYCP